MGEFVCQKCGKVVEDRHVQKVACPYCSTRILVKKGANSVKVLEAE